MKKFRSTALCLLLLLALTVGTSRGSSPCKEGCSLTPGHEGACVLYDAGWQNEADGAWAYGSLAAALHFVEDGGTVKLLRDFYVSPQTGVPMISKSITLTSADPAEPCRLTTAMSPHPTLLGVMADVHLRHVIIDGGAELVANGPLVLVQQGSLTLDEGTVIRNNYNANNARGNNFLGGGVFLYGTMTMKPGSAIENCFAWAGGGVAVVNGGGLTMEGGVIDGCESYQGGGVCVTSGSFTLRGGAVQNCRATKPEPLTELMDQKLASPGEGGGVFLVWHDSLLEMTGGRIEGNSARFGGGVGCDSGILQVSGGTVTGNTAEQYGGGVLASPLLDVRISGDFLVTGNSSGEPGYENLYLDGSEGMDGGTATRPFVVTGPVTADIDLGLARWVHPDAEHPFRVVAVPGEDHTITPEDLAHFISDAPGYVLLLKDGDIVLTTAGVRFENQGHGLPVPDQALASDRKVKAPEPLTAVGYNFGGWYADADCTAAWDFDACVTDYQDTPLTLYAQWTPIAYTISYELNGGAAAEGNPDSYNIETETVALHAPTKVGYNFLGWTWAEHETPEQNAAIPHGSTGNKTFTANWTPIDYTIACQLNGGAAAGEAPGSYTIPYTIESEAITLPTPTRANYDFRGWTSEDQPTPQKTVTIPKGSTGDKTFTAQWTELPKYTVTYQDGAGGAAFADQTTTVYQGAETPKFEGTPARSGYGFTQWEPAVTPHVSADAVYTAQWTPTPYTISYELNGGTAAEGDPTVYTIETETIALKRPTKEGYTFTGWTEHDQDTPEVNMTIPQGSTGHKSFTAHFKPITYEIVYDFGGGTVVIENPDHYTVESPDITLHPPIKTGYTFRGWTWVAHETPEQNAGIPHGSTEKKSFTAQWEPISYKITYRLNGGSVVVENPDHYTIESDAITLHPPERPGYNFLGWTADDLGEPQLTVTIPKGSIEEMTFTAHWEELPSTSPSGGVYYTLTATAGPGGKLSPGGTVRVRHGRDQVFAVIPDEGCAIADVLVDGVSVGAVGEYTFARVTKPHTIEARFQKAVGVSTAYRSCPRDVTCPIWPYTDASTTAWYHDGVHYCIENALMIGYGDDIFAPYDTLSRAMLAQILYNKKGRPAAPDAAPFDDVPADVWYAPAVAWAAQNGVVGGYGNGAFGPVDPVTREQLAAMLWRYAGRPESGESLARFPDSDKTGPWAVAALRWVVEQGIVVGRDTGVLDPAATASRAEAAAMVQRFCEVVK